MVHRTPYTVHNCHLHLSTLGLSTQCTTAPPPPPPNPPWDFLRSVQPPPQSTLGLSTQCTTAPPPHPVPRFHLLVCCIMFTTKTGWWRPGNVAYLVRVWNMDRCTVWHAGISVFHKKNSGGFRGGKCTPLWRRVMYFCVHNCTSPSNDNAGVACSNNNQV